ncbi:unnamed protein product [marine sediment metagenome]|uniref:Uncharacterized protein n=1 Tax=marine sediment metagenome TaxID=412755 RepID=X1RTI5_9ZZZZ
MEADDEGYAGVWWLNGDYCVVNAEEGFGTMADYGMSLKGLGSTPAGGSRVIIVG